MVFDFTYTTWFEANLSAVLGAICELLTNQGKHVVVGGCNYAIQDVLQRNRFLCEFGYEPKRDIHQTMVAYTRFNPNEGDRFLEYIKNKLLAKPDFPSHSPNLGKKIRESIFELYENARTHGLCEQIHACGQYFPRKDNIKRLDLSIVDMGQSIKYNVNNYLGSQMTGSEAIEWALKYGNTTKTGDISGGLGLDIMFQFIKLNQGKVQIISSDGYWEYRRGEVRMLDFDLSFPGTIVNIEFNLSDTHDYYLEGEISLDDIF
ncbi:hypothetical protein BFP72_05390 [Reichenbachiella sp. 5M10]|nr:hypothetical protein BFP72_05390 [Reichenbachiella sp. 5M10]